MQFGMLNDLIFLFLIFLFFLFAFVVIPGGNLRKLPNNSLYIEQKEKHQI